MPFASETQAYRVGDGPSMIEVGDVDVVGAKYFLNGEDRKAIRQSKRMALMAVAAVAVAALLPTADEFVPRAAPGGVSSTVAPAGPAASITAADFGSGSGQPQEAVDFAADKFGAGTDYVLTRAAANVREVNGLPNR